MIDILILFFAGLVGGAINSIAGGGSFITFPALLFIGIPPISANATNTFSSCAGYISGAYALKQEILSNKKKLPVILFMSLIGGLFGAWLLLNTPEDFFKKVIPWILLFATVLFTFGEKINKYLKSFSTSYDRASSIGQILLLLLFFAVTIYGGFSSAGAGIIIFSYLVLAGYKNIKAINGLRLFILSTLSLISVALFIQKGTIAWVEGISVLSGTLVGGYLSARVSKKLPDKYIKTTIILISCFMTFYFFYKTFYNADA
ncbi:MAG: sulfite exporter TauE/SafE family protein [Bdellovibrionales bacterium]|nr:sulfite exporter TauE/SafE family protein [Bdellovibrionales bacterium]